MSQLKGKVALVTGAGRPGGLGEAVASRLLEDGCTVVLSDLCTPRPLMDAQHIGTADSLEAVAATLRARGGNVRTYPLDVTDEAQVVQVIDTCAAELGGIDILINNAGIGYLIAALTKTTKAAWDATLAVNLTGAFLCSRQAAIHMVARGRGGRIINIASQAAKSGFPHMAAYVASKHGLVGLTRTSAIELGPHGITVNAVCPNHVTTGLGARQNEYFASHFGQTIDEYMSAMRRSVPMRRTGQAADTANAVAFLCSDAAAYITGEALNVSGGVEMH